MTFDHTPDAVEKEMESHPGTLVAWIGIGTVALIVGIIMLAQLAVGMWGGRSLENDPAMKPEALAARIAPVAKLQLEGTAAVAPAPQGAKVATVAAAPAAAGKPDGKKTYDTACMACHATGAANAPKFGDKAAWAPRIKTGAEALYASSLKGKGAMPPKGGNAALADADVKAAVDYIVAGSK
ncbi:MAG TPA: c-type cytochrome [Usitatibacteraceae bacterium]|nr:c-type cytochrome [Usitatibacteraceae bacterium]